MLGPRGIRNAAQIRRGWTTVRGTVEKGCSSRFCSARISLLRGGCQPSPQHTVRLAQSGGHAAFGRFLPGLTLRVGDFPTCTRQSRASKSKQSKFADLSGRNRANKAQNADWQGLTDWGQAPSDVGRQVIHRSKTHPGMGGRGAADVRCSSPAPRGVLPGLCIAGPLAPGSEEADLTRS